jgi:hypothetical protein
MLYFDGLFGLLTLGLWIFCLADVVTTERGACRTLPKLLWLVLVLLLPLAGSIIWLVAGRPQTPARSQQDDYFRETTLSQEYDRPGYPGPDDALDDDEAFQRQCRERAEAQRRAAKELRRDEG